MCVSVFVLCKEKEKLGRHVYVKQNKRKHLSLKKCDEIQESLFECILYIFDGCYKKTRMSIEGEHVYRVCDFFLLKIHKECSRSKMY